MFNVIFLIFIYIYKLFEFELQFNLMIKDFSIFFYFYFENQRHSFREFPLISFVCIQVYTIFNSNESSDMEIQFEEVFFFCNGTHRSYWIFFFF